MKLIHMPVLIAFLSASTIPLVPAEAGLAPLADCSTVTQIPLAECQALLALYNSTNGPGWANGYGHWFSSSTPCTWYGVSCGTDPEPVMRVRQVALAENQLSGSIPPELGNLQGLEYLGLGANQLSGRIPPELGNLSDLESLGLSGNQLSGAVPPELGNLAGLRYLGLNSNQLRGPLPQSLTKLQLYWFYFDTDHLCVPANIAFLQWLAGIQEKSTGATACTDCSTVAEIPTGECQALVTLYNHTDGPTWTLYDHWLRTDTPCGWYGVTCDTGHVTSLVLAGNQLSGTMPPELGNLGNLSDLHLESNQLSGRLPQALTNLQVLNSFHFDTGLLCLPDNAAFAGWLAGIADVSPGARTCQPCYLPALKR